jgi:hypothetical protein
MRRVTTGTVRGCFIFLDFLEGLPVETGYAGSSRFRLSGLGVNSVPSSVFFGVRLLTAASFSSWFAPFGSANSTRILRESEEEEDFRVLPCSESTARAASSFSENLETVEVGCHSSSSVGVER